MGPSVPEEEKATWRERLFSLRNVIMPILLIIIVLGTIFGGIATPSEAAAMGALGALFCALVSNRLTWELFKNANYQTLRISCMIIWIILAGQCLTSIYTASGAVGFIKGVVELLPVSRYMILIGMQLTLFVLGMLLDPGGIIMITTPVFVPVIRGLGFDPVWFGVLFMVNLEMAYLTPPFGLNLFYVKSIVPNSIKMIDIYSSVTPFVVLQAIGLVLFIIFPEIVLWLPNMLIK
jgi:tripartite ATP-independent transporter DctM subunit